jgi:hypothetical protein
VAHIFGAQIRDNHNRSPVFAFLPYCCSLSYSFQSLLFRGDYFGFSNVFMVVFYMNMDDYPQCYLGEDGSLCSTGQYRPGFLRVL